MIESILSVFAPPVYANCPVCIVTVGGGLLIAKKLGIDDLLVSIWLSGLNTAIAIWFATKIKIKILNNPLVMSLAFYALTIVYLLFSKQIGHPKNTYLGVDKVSLGMTMGLAVFLLSVFVDKLIRYKNNKKVLFPYQKVIVPVVLLTLTTLIFGLLLK